MEKDNNESLQEKKPKIESKHSLLENNKENNIELLNSENMEIIEETIMGIKAIQFLDIIKNPSKDPKREKMIKKALFLFPKPDKPTEIDLKL